MAWTTPRTWVAGEVVTAALLNTHLRDNLNAISGLWTAWTPTITATAGTFTTVSAAGRYTQIGKTVIWSLTITMTTAGTASNYLQFTLPATAAAGNGSNIGSGRATLPTVASSAQVFLASSTTARVSTYNDGSVIGSGYVAYLSGEYEAA